MDIDPTVWLTRKEVSTRQKIPVATLAGWASQGKGPRYALFGRHARYRLVDLVEWENARLGAEASEDECDGAGADQGLHVQ